MYRAHIDNCLLLFVLVTYNFELKLRTKPDRVNAVRLAVAAMAMLIFFPWSDESKINNAVATCNTNKIDLKVSKVGCRLPT